MERILAFCGVFQFILKLTILCIRQLDLRLCVVDFMNVSAAFFFHFV